MMVGIKMEVKPEHGAIFARELVTAAAISANGTRVLLRFRNGLGATVTRMLAWEMPRQFEVLPVIWSSAEAPLFSWASCGNPSGPRTLEEVSDELALLATMPQGGMN